MNELTIGNRRVGKSSPAFIIAEIGSNHNGDLQRAKESIAAAAEAGADAVKFQSLNIDHQYFSPNDEIRELHRKIDLPESWYPKLKEECDRFQVEFFSSPAYLRSVDLLEDVGVRLYKLASAQVGTFPQIIEKVAATGKPAIMSTGIVTFSQLEQAVRIFIRNGNPSFAILHCNSIYPTPPEKVHLPLMGVYQSMFHCPAGFSDHTIGISIPLAAVALGADIIEKHFILDDSIESVDAAFSLNPEQFSEMVGGIRKIESALLPSTRTEIDPRENSSKR